MNTRRPRRPGKKAAATPRATVKEKGGPDAEKPPGPAEGEENNRRRNSPTSASTSSVIIRQFVFYASALRYGVFLASFERLSSVLKAS
jgi:hypothetical protein